MYKQILILVYLTCISVGVGQRLFTKVNDKYTKVLHTFYYWTHLTYDFDGVEYMNDTVARWTPDSVFFKDDDKEETDVFLKLNHNIPTGFEFSSDPYVIYITVPRRNFGVPSTLNYFTSKTKRTKIPLKPYPDVASVPSLVSVYSCKLDECNRLWAVDTGLLEIPDNHQQVKPPEIIAFNVTTNKEILRYPLKSTDLVNGTTSGLRSISIDANKNNCSNTYAYITDSTSGGIIVFSLEERDSWRFSHPTFTYDAGAAFDLRNEVINKKEGICSIALSEPDDKGVRKAYYHPFLSTQEFSITTDILKDRNADFDKHYKIEGIRGPLSQSGVHAYHPVTKILFFANIAQDGILCWNVQKPLSPENTALLVHKETWLTSISAMRVLGTTLFFLSNQQTRLEGWSWTPSVGSNLFLIIGANIEDLIRDTVCKVEL